MADVLLAQSSDDTTVEKARIDKLTKRLLVTLGGMAPPDFDDIVLTYDGSNRLTTVAYKLATVTLRTLTLSYDGASNLIEVVRS